MSRFTWLHVLVAVLCALAILLVLRVRNAGGATLPADSISAGHRLAEAWCKDCHAIDAKTAGAKGGPPDFVAIANRPSTTALSLKVFLRPATNGCPI
ncbi:cytochrome c [Bradyrhizobium icense]|uniref:cytochrome c n=1 Tax=Bradyrhizobium icense TaxID=1274631 RepID=UPI00267C1C98